MPLPGNNDLPGIMWELDRGTLCSCNHRGVTECFCRLSVTMLVSAITPCLHSLPECHPVIWCVHVSIFLSEKQAEGLVIGRRETESVVRTRHEKNVTHGPLLTAAGPLVCQHKASDRSWIAFRVSIGSKWHDLSAAAQEVERPSSDPGSIPGSSGVDWSVLEQDTEPFTAADAASSVFDCVCEWVNDTD